MVAVYSDVDNKDLKWDELDNLQQYLDNDKLDLESA
jgi:hypothetical protein